MQSRPGLFVTPVGLVPVCILGEFVSHFGLPAPGFSSESTGTPMDQPWECLLPDAPSPAAGSSHQGSTGAPTNWEWALPPSFNYWLGDPTMKIPGCPRSKQWVLPFEANNWWEHPPYLRSSWELPLVPPGCSHQ
ncbi:hypothetical protein DFH07DRAFT_775803 [Mycena maculata]|uniref:Uncharacterized protein n=1 Tax=Mycena maculata TaxID=230809 RepID=A0AAD7IQ62_9AGAR|nr:hypothetical protein DFH07DRAFT_775803 [Mycena maculata]